MNKKNTPKVVTSNTWVLDETRAALERSMGKTKEQKIMCSALRKSNGELRAEISRLRAVLDELEVRDFASRLAAATVMFNKDAVISRVKISPEQ